jgi:hypothetical protein
MKKGSLEGHQRFRRTCCLHLQDGSQDGGSMFVRNVGTHQTIRSHDPKYQIWILTAWKCQISYSTNITVFTVVRHWSLAWIRLMQSIPSHFIILYKTRFNVTVLPSGCVFQVTSTVRVSRSKFCVLFIFMYCNISQSAHVRCSG